MEKKDDLQYPYTESYPSDLQDDFYERFCSHLYEKYEGFTVVEYYCVYCKHKTLETPLSDSLKHK